MGALLLLGGCGGENADQAAVTLKAPGEWSTCVLPSATSVPVPAPPKGSSPAQRADDRAVAERCAAAPPSSCDKLER